MSRREERPTDANAIRSTRSTRATDARTEGKAQELAAAYRGGKSIRALVSDTGHSYGYIHRRISGLVQMRPKGRVPRNDDGE